MSKGYDLIRINVDRHLPLFIVDYCRLQIRVSINWWWWLAAVWSSRCLWGKFKPAYGHRWCLPSVVLFVSKYWFCSSERICFNWLIIYLITLFLVLQINLEHIFTTSRWTSQQSNYEWSFESDLSNIKYERWMSFLIWWYRDSKCMFSYIWTKSRKT